MQTLDTETIRIEIGKSTLLKILTSHAITATEFRCLDAQSKQHVWQLCLKACASKL